MIQKVWDITLTVSDLKKSVDFYENVLGLVKKYEFADYAGFDCGGVEIGLKTWGELDKPRQGEPCLNFQVENVDKSYAFLKKQGVRFTKEPADTLWGSRTAVLLDPDGNALQLSQIYWDKYFASCVPS